MRNVFAGLVAVSLMCGVTLAQNAPRDNQGTQPAGQGQTGQVGQGQVAPAQPVQPGQAIQPGRAVQGQPVPAQPGQPTIRPGVVGQPDPRAASRRSASSVGRPGNRLLRVRRMPQRNRDRQVRRVEGQKRRSPRICSANGSRPFARLPGDAAASRSVGLGLASAASGQQWWPSRLDQHQEADRPAMPQER